MTFFKPATDADILRYVFLETRLASEMKFVSWRDELCIYTVGRTLARVEARRCPSLGTSEAVKIMRILRDLEADQERSLLYCEMSGLVRSSHVPEGIGRQFIGNQVALAATAWDRVAARIKWESFPEVVSSAPSNNPEFKKASDHYWALEREEVIRTVKVVRDGSCSLLFDLEGANRFEELTECLLRG